MCCVIDSFMDSQFFHPLHRSPQTDRKGEKERERFMNGQRGSDVVPGTGRDTLTAEGEGGVRWFFLWWKKSWNAGRRKRRMDDWMKGWMGVAR